MSKSFPGPIKLFMICFFLSLNLSFLTILQHSYFNSVPSFLFNTNIFLHLCQEIFSTKPYYFLAYFVYSSFYFESNKHLFCLLLFQISTDFHLHDCNMIISSYHIIISLPHMIIIILLWASAALWPTPVPCKGIRTAKKRQQIQKEEKEEEDILVKTFECLYLSERERHWDFYHIFQWAQVKGHCSSSVAYSIKVFYVLGVILPPSRQSPTLSSASVIPHYCHRTSAYPRG